MDSVRFSIIEDNWNQQNSTKFENNNPHHDPDDIKSEISSEGSECCLTQVDTMNTHSSNHRFDQEIWETSEITQTLKELPNAELIIKIIETGSIPDLLQEYVNTALLIAAWYARPDFIIILFNSFNADANTCDLKGRTPLHLSCSIGDPIISKILLRNGANANQWDTIRKATPLHCAASSGSVECIQILLRNGANVNSGIERRSALHYAVEKNATNCVQTLLQYGASPNTPQVYTETPLHVAAALGLKECIKLLLEHGADVRSQYGKKRLTALHLAVEEDYVNCIELLLDAGANIDARNVDNQTALHLTCLLQYPETLDLLIKRGANVNAVYKDGRTALHAAIVKESKSWECARQLLNAGVDVNKPDNYGYTPLHLAALNEFSSCAHLLIDYGADVTARTNGGVSALSFIVRRTPDVIPKVLSKFDSSIKVHDHEIGDVDCEIKLNFRLLVPNTERGETDLLLTFIEVGQKRVLKHPLCETFLFLKWRRIRKFFLFSLFFHAFYVLLFTLYVLGVYVKDCPSLTHLSRFMVPEPCKAGYYVIPLGYVVVFLNLIHLAKEIFQMAHGFSGYYRYWENWLQWCIIIGVFFCTTPSTILAGDIKLLPQWQHHIAAVIIFCVWLELMMLVGRFPIFGLYVQMFQTVAVNFSKFLLAYCCLIIAFGLSFGVLFANYPAFKKVPWALLKTFIMMAGELEFEDIFYGDKKVEYPVTAHGMFFAFVILVTVILTNLLVGLAVNDIQGLQASAGLDRLSRQAEVVARLEGLFFSRLLRKAPKRLLEICQRNALLRTSRCHLQFCIRPNDPREKRLPKELILSIYKLVAERRDKNQSIKKQRNDKNYTFFQRTVSDNNEVQLRNTSSNNLRYRTVSDNPGIIIKPKSPPIINNVNNNNNFEDNNAKLTEVLAKMELFQTIMTKRLDELKKDIHTLKLNRK